MDSINFDGHNIITVPVFGDVKRMEFGKDKTAHDMWEELYNRVFNEGVREGERRRAKLIRDVIDMV